MVGNFRSFEDWRHFYDYETVLPAMKKECESGGRYTHWLGYRSRQVPDSGGDFLSLDGFPLDLDLWKKGQPNAKSGDQCLVSYMSRSLNDSWYDFNCVQTSWSWAMCSACILPHSLFNQTVLTLRGLCSRTSFDISYQVINNEEGYVMFKGVKNTIIQFNFEGKLWKMSLVNNPSIYATSSTPFSELILGLL